jgi:tagatose-6-phosphate ketose/aldose isomerase
MDSPLSRLTKLSPEEKRTKGILYTPEEIAHQVELWSDTFSRVEEQRDELADFISDFKKERTVSALCTGAGTSEFVGHCIDGLIRKKLGIPVNVVSTPKIVTTPHDFFISNYATLLLSFARSGNSPESLGTVKIADMVSDKIYHLVVTCDVHGALYRETGGLSKSKTLVLDERTNDQGLAMTGAFTNMLIAGQMLAYLFAFQEYADRFASLLQAGESMLDQAPAVVEEISQMGYKRAVFLGDGSNIGTAIESHLKLQELTSGKVMCAWDTFPGLRHGPEAVIDADTLVIAYLSHHGYTQRYELDLLQEIRDKKIGRAVLTVAYRITDELKQLSDYWIGYGSKSEPVADDLIPPVYIIVGQLLGLFTSLQLGLKPDAPSESGIIHRVVEGVKVYDPIAYDRNHRFQVLAER